MYNHYHEQIFEIGFFSLFFSYETYLVHKIQRPVRNLVPMQTGVVSALPRNQNGERLDVLDAQLNHQRLVAELLRTEIQENAPPQLGGLFASQPSSVSSLNKFLMVLQPLPQFLRLAATRQRVFCK